MDWSSVYEDEGQENGDWESRRLLVGEGELISSRMTMLDRLALLGKSGGQLQYTPFICYAFTVNYILGVGCLGIPFAFQQSGMLLGTILIVVLSFISYVTVLWIAAATQQELKICFYNLTKGSNPFILSPKLSYKSRKLLSKAPIDNFDPTNNNENKPIRNLVSSLSLTNLWSLASSGYKFVSGEDSIPSIETNIDGGNNRSKHAKLDRVQSNRALSSSHYSSSVGSNISGSTLAMTASSQSTNSVYGSIENDNSSNPNTATNDSAIMEMRELEVTDLADEFLGVYGKIAYQFTLMALTYVGLLAYTQVFNGTFVSQIWSQSPAYLPPLLFSIVVVPLSCFDLSEQIAAQVLMSVLRFLSLGILLFGTLVALLVDYSHSSLSYAHKVTFVPIDSNDISLMQWQGFGVMFTTAIFSQLFQHSVPGLIRPLREEDKKYVPMVFKYALITTATIYISTGIVCVLYFGRNIQQSINLNFVDFTWGLDLSDGQYSSGFGVFVRSMAMIVVLFPALDTLSVFPLIAITLGNNLNAAFPSVTKLVIQTQIYADKAKLKRLAVIIWRLVASIPPIVLSLAVKNLVVSLQIAGLCGIAVALVTPALLHSCTKHRVELIPISMQTRLPFPDYFNKKYMVMVVLLLAALAMIISAGQMIGVM